MFEYYSNFVKYFNLNSAINFTGKLLLLSSNQQIPRG